MPNLFDVSLPDKNGRAETHPVRESFLRWLDNEDTTRQDHYRMYREYYDGVHDTQLTERMRRYLQIKIGQEFNINYCPIVVDALKERLSITGFDAGSLSETVQEWWDHNRMDAVQSVVHLAALRDGDAYIITEWDNESDMPVFTPEMAYDGTEGVQIHYSSERRGVPLAASKRWRVEAGENTGFVRRLNLYYPDRIEKYKSDQREFEGDWRPYQPDDDPSWPLWWTDTGTEGGEPLGLPVIHFKNREQGYNYGQSEIADVVPIQNALNKSVIDLLAAADTTAFRIFYMLGDDPSGLEVSPGSWVYTERPPGGDEGADIGAIDGEDLSPLIKLKDSVAMEIARVSRTPLSYFQISGQRPAEGTLKQEESGLVAKAEDRQIVFGNAWEDVLHTSVRMHNAFGSGDELPADETISTLWDDPQTRNLKELLEALEILQKFDVPTEELWRQTGMFDEAKIDEMLEMREREDAASRRSLAQAMLEQRRRFDQGEDSMDDMMNGDVDNMGGEE